MLDIFPDTCVPTSTSDIGSIVPVAVTEVLMSPIVTFVVTSCMLSFDEPFKKK